MTGVGAFSWMARVVLLAAASAGLAACTPAGGGGNMMAERPRVMAQVIQVERGCKVGIEVPGPELRAARRPPQDFERSDAMPCERAASVAQSVRERGARSFPVTQVLYSYILPIDNRERRGVIEFEQWFDGGGGRVMRTGNMMMWLPDRPRWSGTFDPSDPQVGTTIEILANPRDPPIDGRFWG